VAGVTFNSGPNRFGGDFGTSMVSIGLRYKFGQ